MALVAITVLTNGQIQTLSVEAVASVIPHGYLARGTPRIAPHLNETSKRCFAGILCREDDASETWCRNGPAALASRQADRTMAIVLAFDMPRDQDTSWGFEDLNDLDRDAANALIFSR